MTRFQGLGFRWFGSVLACLLVQPALAQDSGGVGTLIVEVPEDAKVEINGHPTRATGSQREYTAVDLEPGLHYEYRIRVEVVRSGRTLEQSRTVRLAAGETVRVAFGPFQAASEVQAKEPTPAAKGAATEPKVKGPPVEPKPKGPPVEPKPKAALPGPEAKKSTSAQSQVPLAAPGAVTPPATPKKQPEAKPPAAKMPETPRRAHKKPPVEDYLLDGRLADGERAMAARLKENPRDDEARFSLGGVQFLRAVERLLQSMYIYGMRSPTSGPLGAELPLLRVPVPANRDPNSPPKPLSYLQAREILKTFLDDLATAEATLAPIRDEQVRLPIHVGQIRLDVRGDADVQRGGADVQRREGDRTNMESLWQIYARLAGQPALSEAEARDLVVCFDLGDAYWLRGYCHVLMALGEMVLAYDEQDFFERTAFLLFPNVVPSNRSLVSEPWESSGGLEGSTGILPVLRRNVDLVAVAHLARFSVYEPERMGRALEHLQNAVAMSRASWQAILAETDDDCEWIPNPEQHCAIPGVEVTRPMVDAWRRFLDEADALLSGKKLLPYWRRPPPPAGQPANLPPRAGKPAGKHDLASSADLGIKKPAPGPRPVEQRGVNLNRLFTQPQPFDLILWVQGSGVAAFLDTGAVVDAEVWRQIEEAFAGKFPWFALWCLGSPGIGILVAWR